MKNSDNSLIKRASNYYQYDNNLNKWSNNTQTPLVNTFLSYLIKYKRTWKDSNIIDIGCGTGWLIYFIDKLKISKEIIGLDPSLKNFEKAKKLNPSLSISNETFYKFKSNIKFDVAFSIMIVQHIRNLKMFFKKTYKILNKGGFLHIIAPDYDYFCSNRYNYDVYLKNINKDETAVHTFRPKYGHFFDIIRKVGLYLDLAEKEGFVLIDNKPVIISKELVNKERKYSHLMGRKIAHHLVFRKT